VISRKKLIIYIAVVLVFAGGITAITFWPEAEDLSPSPSPSASTGPTELIAESTDDITKVSYMPREGVPYAIRYDSDEDEYTLDAEGVVFPGRQSDMRSMFSYSIRLTYLTNVTEDATDFQLGAFGLDDPVMVWRVDKKDGTSVELMIGARQAAGIGSYARKVGSREVFLLNSTQSGFLTKSMEDFYDMTFFPYPASTEDNQTWYAISYCLIENNGDTIEINKRSDDEFAELPMGSSIYYLTQPVACETNEYTLQKNMLEPITNIRPTRVIEAFPADLSPYGLDDPVKLTLACEDEWEGILYIGAHDEEQGGRYVMIDGYDAVLLDIYGDYSFLNVKYDYLRASLVWLYSIKTVDSITYELEGVTRILQYEHDDEEETLQAWLDGLELTESNGRRLYTGTLSVTQAGKVDMDIPAGDPDFRITIHFRDGGSDVMELYQINEAQYLIVHGGVNEGLVINRITLRQNLLNRFDALDRGEDLQM